MPIDALFGAVTSTEFVDLTSCVHDFLLAGIKRMAGGADFNADIFTGGRASYESVATATRDVDLFLLWVDIRFHDIRLCARVKIRRWILGPRSVNCKPRRQAHG